MKLIFKEYLDIFEKYPKDKYLTREERKERYKLLQEYEKRNYQDEISTDEFKDFISSYIDKIDVSSQFIGKFLKVIKKDDDWYNEDCWDNLYKELKVGKKDE